MSSHLRPWFFCLFLSLTTSIYGESLADNPVVGAWLFQQAVGNGAASYPMTVTFLTDGTVVTNDAGEFLDSDTHGTGKGVWRITGTHTVEATSVFLSLDRTKPNGYLGAYVSVFSITHDPARDEVAGHVVTSFYAEGTDPLAVNSGDGEPFSTGELGGGRRIEADPGAPNGAQSLSGEIPVGIWFGTAVADDPATAAFPDFALEPTFRSDGAVFYNDVQDLAQLYTTAHGQWVKTGANTFDAVVVRANLTSRASTTLDGWVKVRLSGVIDPANPDALTGTVELISFPANGDPLDPGDAGGTSMGTYSVGAANPLSRLKSFASPGHTSGAALTGDLAVGTWFGKAVPDDPATSPFPEVYMTPSFTDDGNFIANDAVAVPSALQHGDWVRVDDDTVEATFLFLNGTPDPAMPLGALFRVKFTATINPAEPNVMTGKVAPELFFPGENPLDLGTPGVPVGTLTFNLRRVQSALPIVGAWFFHDGTLSGAIPHPVEISFLKDGTFVLNEASEFLESDTHGTSKGVWRVSGYNTVEATSTSLSLDRTKPNGYLGSHRSVYSFTHDKTRDELDASVTTTFFAEGTNPLETNCTQGGVPGTALLTNGRRIRTDPSSAPIVPDLGPEVPVGIWFGTAVADDPATAPFPNLAIEPTLRSDGTVFYNDAQELSQLYTTAHGQWLMTGPDSFEAVVVRADLASRASTALDGLVKVRISGVVDPSNPDELTGTVELISFPPNGDPLDPSDTGGTSMGTYTLGASNPLGRLKSFSSPGQQSGAALASDLAVGTWFGRAVPDDPATSPFPEVYMTPTFTDDGNFIANDAVAVPSSLQHGNWVRVNDTTAEATFLFINGTPDPAMPLGALFRVKFTAVTDPAIPDFMTGTVAPELFFPGQDPLDLGTAGVPVGTLSFALHRVRAKTDFDTWAASHLQDPTQRGFQQNPDHGGHANGLEAFFGTNPALPNASSFRVVSTTPSSLVFEHPFNASLPCDVTGGYQWSPDLETWYDSGGGPDGGPTVTFHAVGIAGATTVTATSDRNLTPIFVRIVATRTTP